MDISLSFTELKVLLKLTEDGMSGYIPGLSKFEMETCELIYEQIQQSIDEETYLKDI
jgi:hypothetical protein